MADTPEKKTLGLSQRKELPPNQGMLFVWEKNTYTAFWMKDMNFPIDIIWINDGKVLGIEENAQPEPGKKDNELKLYLPPSPVDRVLEVNAGFSQKNGIKVGDGVEFSASNLLEE